MSRNTFNVIFFIKKLKVNKKGEVPIYGRITVNGERAEFSTARRVLPEKWNVGSVKGKTTELKAIQQHLETLKQRIFTVHTERLNEGAPITAKILKENIQLTPKKGKSLMEAFEYKKKQMLELGKKSTYKKYNSIQVHAREFLRLQNGKTDIPLSELKYQFIQEFVHFLQSTQNISHNTSRRYMKQLKTILQIAEDNEWIESSPFKRFTMKMKDVDQVFLTQSELKLIEDKKIEIERLAEIKDAFLFACYTGLAYVDLEKLTRNEIISLDDGSQMIVTRRTKTATKATIPLLEKALALIEKYKSHPSCEESGKILPMKSNQKYNAYLKEIQTICGIEKKLTSHVARRTFGTILLNNGVPLDMVQKALGHKKIEQTQEYAKLLNKTMIKTFEKLDGIF